MNHDDPTPRRLARVVALPPPEPAVPRARPHGRRSAHAARPGGQRPLRAADGGPPPRHIAPLAGRLSGRRRVDRGLARPSVQS